MPALLPRLTRAHVESLFTKYSDLVLVGLVVAIVGMMVVPLPTFLLDILISLNITVSVILLLVAIYVTDALKIAAFPTLLLISTLFRLGLNVSSTRLILLQADAGEVIRSFGSFVVSGNYVVGAVVFLLLTLIQFIVISKGSERVAEVAARFALDAMPGKQMAIDADVRSGHIDQEEARKRRATLQRESQLYGSMDGAMKFVKGDAIAGVCIIAINIIGGLIVGVMQRNMPVGEAAKVYTLLTIGDGLVSQIPALVISMAAGMIVTRVANETEGAHLGSEIGSQIIAQPKAIAFAAGLLGFLALIPGLPTVPFLLLALTTGSISWLLLRKTPGDAAASAARSAPGSPPRAAQVDEVRGISPVAIELAEDLAEVTGVAPHTGGTFVSELIPELRRSLFDDLGVNLPPVRVRRIASLGSGAWSLSLWETPVAGGVLKTDMWLAAHDAERLLALGVTGQPTASPLDGKAAAWIRPEDQDKLVRAGVRVWNPARLVAETTRQALCRHAHELLGIQEVHVLIDNLEKAYPVLVREVVPKIISPQVLTDVVKRLVEEQVSIRDMRAILGALADWGRAEKDPVLLTEYVRASLKRQITFQHTLGTGALPVFLVDQVIEDAVREAITKTQTGSYLALEPALSRDILASVRRSLLGSVAPHPVILTNWEIRRFMKRLVELEHPRVSVLSFQELMPSANVQPIGRITVS